MKRSFRLSISIIVFVTLLFAFAMAGSAETRSTATIGMFPKQMTDFAYANLKEAQKYPWFGYIRHELMPDRFRQFDQFLNSIGLDLTSHMDELYWGTATVARGTEQIVGAATGEFEIASIEDHLQSEQVPSFDFHGFKIYAFGTGGNPGDILFTFIDSTMVAFGQRDALEALIDVRTGAADGLFLNEKLYPLIGTANGSALIWSVLGPDYSRRTLQDLVADIGQVPQITAITSKLKAMVIGVDTSDDGGMQLDFQTVCDSPDDANLLAAAIQAGLLYQRYRTAGANSALASILGQARVMPHGDRLEASFALGREQLEALALSGNPLLAF